MCMIHINNLHICVVRIIRLLGELTETRCLSIAHIIHSQAHHLQYNTNISKPIEMRVKFANLRDDFCVAGAAFVKTPPAQQSAALLHGIKLQVAILRFSSRDSRAECVAPTRVHIENIKFISFELSANLCAPRKRLRVARRHGVDGVVQIAGGG